MDRRSAPALDLKEITLSSVHLYDIPPLDPEPGLASSFLEPHIVSYNSLLFHQIRPPMFEVSYLNGHPVTTNFTFQPAVFLLNQYPGRVTSPPSVPILSHPLYHPCCICPQSDAVYPQPSYSNQVGWSVAVPPQDPCSKQATVEEQQPQAATLAIDKYERKSHMLSQRRPLCLDEDTLKERIFEEYNAIMDSLEMEEKEDNLLKEPFKNYERFLELLDELCSNTGFVKNVGSILDMDYWNSLTCSDQVPVDLSEQQTEEKEQSPELPRCDQTSAPDGDVPPAERHKEVWEKDEEELQNAVASIVTAPTGEAPDEKARLSGVQESVPVMTPASRDDCVCPVGSSPLLPSHATPDYYRTTFSSPLDKATYRNNTSLRLDASTPLSSDLSAENPEAPPEILLQEESRGTESVDGGKDASESSNSAEKSAVPMRRSRRLSLEMNKLCGGRDATHEPAVSHFVRCRNRSVTVKTGPKTLSGVMPRCRSPGDGAWESQNQDQTSSSREEDFVPRGKSRSSPGKRRRPGGGHFREDDREMTKKHQCPPKKKLRLECK